jgi:hypothetical protein
MRRVLNVPVAKPVLDPPRVATLHCEWVSTGMPESLRMRVLNFSAMASRRGRYLRSFDDIEWAGPVHTGGMGTREFG